MFEEIFEDQAQCKVCGRWDYEDEMIMDIDQTYYVCRECISKSPVGNVDKNITPNLYY